MKFIDMHCDTLLLKLKKGVKNNLLDNDGCVDFIRMKQGDCAAQFFAVFMLPHGSFERLGLEPLADWDYINFLHKEFNADVAANPDLIKFASNISQHEANLAEGKMSAFLTLEDGRAIEGDMKNIDRLYDMGFRLISLTWNHPNCFGAPNSKDPEIMGQGLTDFGKEAIAYMNQKGMVIDVSHLSDGGFWDVVNLSKKPFVASHSNARILSPHQRNLKDDMIKALGEAGGCTGINFGPEFLNEDITIKDSTVELMVKHIQHIKNTGGIGCVALGSDFDGVSGNLEIASAAHMQMLFDALSKNGFPDGEIEMIAYKNVERIIRESMV